MAHILIWSISAASIALMLFRPFGISEAVWTVAGALLLCILRLISWNLAGHAVAEGLDVYLFLTGMMLLSELAKVHGVFDWLANIAVEHGDGSPARLFTLIYLVGTIVTIFMSNDATAVVLTPAVLSAVKRTQVRPLPYLLICALIANAASFVLPISNPANLVVFHSAMPPLSRWLAMFSLPSIVSIIVTYFALRWYCRRDMSQRGATASDDMRLSASGKTSLFGILFVAAVLLVVSALRMDLGLPTCLASLLVAVIVLIREKANPLPIVRGISWSILPLVAALFVIVEAVKSAGALQILHRATIIAMQWPAAVSIFAVGGLVGFGTNLVNNLPLGLIAGSTLQTVPFHPLLAKAVLIGVDLGPNLSITGSLATILWLTAIRREGMHMSGWQFLKAGMIVMPASLILTLGAALLSRY
ncbi:MAG TPA: arsenic transporter [Silvibacterium sp.]|nr:arsenic transporter [Silvibacterium sp.]